MKRVLIGALRCANLTTAYGLVCLVLWVVGVPGDGGDDTWLRFGFVLLALHVVALLAGIGLVVANRTGIGMIVAAAPAVLFVGTFVVLNVGREMLPRLRLP